MAMYNILNSEITLSFDTCKDDGEHDLQKIRQCPFDKKFYTTGGNENDVQIWNIESEKPEIPVFKAKNVPHDNLDLRLPVWVQDLTFLPRTTELVAAGTRYGQVRLYDVREVRPVSNVQFVDHPIMSITATMNDHQVVVGTARGEAGLYDLRFAGKEKLCLKYTGFSGSIRTMVACTDQPYVVSSGLDRHLCIHKFDTRIPVKKVQTIRIQLELLFVNFIVPIVIYICGFIFSTALFKSTSELRCTLEIVHEGPENWYG